MPESIHHPRPPAADGESQNWQLTGCRGTDGCRFALTPLAALKDQIDAVLRESGWDAFLPRQYPRGVKPHHRLRIALSACANGCSQPQIQDVGLIAALRPLRVLPACTACGTCERICREEAIAVAGATAVLRPEACLACGECVRACPASALQAAPPSFRILVGGHLGRHPAWAVELPGTAVPDQIPHILRRFVELLIREARTGERVWQIVERVGAAAVGHALVDATDEAT